MTSLLLRRHLHRPCFVCRSRTGRTSWSRVPWQRLVILSDLPVTLQELSSPRLTGWVE